MRRIRRGPLIDLPALQQAILDGAIAENAVDVVNRSCDDDLDRLEWNLQDILDCLLCATAADYRTSEWCDTNLAGRVACDVYVIPYDETARRRAPRALEFYLKFSLDESATLRIQMVRAHLSR